VNVVGPRVIFTTNFGDQTYSFDVGMPIDATSLTLNGQSQELTAAQAPKLDTTEPATAGSAAAAGTSAATDSTPGEHDRFGRLIVNANVRAELAYGGPALMGVWNGTAAGVPQTRDMLKAYAQTHGYKFDEVVNRPYDIQVQPEVRDAGGNVTTYAKFDVYLPLAAGAPEQTPEQAAGMQPPTLDVPSAASAPAPASASSAPANASSGGE
jgi:hypothetical protein